MIKTINIGLDAGLATALRQAIPHPDLFAAAVAGLVSKLREENDDERDSITLNMRQGAIQALSGIADAALRAQDFGRPAPPQATIGKKW